MMPFPLFLALKYLKPKRSVLSVVTLLSVLGVLLGVAILVIVISVMTGFDHMWRSKILDFKPHLIVTSQYGPLLNEDELIERIEKVDGVTGVAGCVRTRVLLSHANWIASPVVLGMDSERAATVSRVASPRYMVGGEFRLDGEEAVMGIDLVRSIHAAVGSRVLMHSAMNLLRPDELYLPEEVTVTGVFDMGMAEYDSEVLFTSLDVGRRLRGLDEGVDLIFVMIEDPFQFDALRGRIGLALMKLDSPTFSEVWRRFVGGTLMGPYTIRTWDEEDRQLFDALRHEKLLMFILLVFITIVAIFCVTNTLIVITVQKTGEIGLLKALGFPSSQITAAFVFHGWIQCLAGIALGMWTGRIVLRNLKRIVEWLAVAGMEVFPKAIYGIDGIPYYIDVWEWVRIGVFVFAFCTVASLFPAYRAARLDPVKALRQE